MTQPGYAASPASVEAEGTGARCPDIIVYAQHSTESEAPAGMRYAAAMVPRIVPAKGKRPAYTEAGTSWVATGSTPIEARAKLEAMWIKQWPPVSEKELASRAARKLKAAAKSEGQ